LRLYNHFGRLYLVFLFFLAFSPNVGQSQSFLLDLQDVIIAELKNSTINKNTPILILDPTKQM